MAIYKRVYKGKTSYRVQVTKHFTTLEEAEIYEKALSKVEVTLPPTKKSKPVKTETPPWLFNSK
jgi:hypothetical protein